MSSATVIGKVIPTLSPAFPQPVDNSLSWIDLSEVKRRAPWTCPARRGSRSGGFETGRGTRYSDVIRKRNGQPARRLILTQLRTTVSLQDKALIATLPPVS